MTDPIDAAAFVAPTFGQRLGGRLVDSVILLPVLFVLALPISTFAARACVFAVEAVYEIMGVTLWGQTIGKRVVGTRVVSTISDEIQPAQAVIRFLCYGAAAFVLTALGAGFLGSVWTLVVVLPVLRPPLHRGLHDYAARTIVVPTRASSTR